MSLKSSIYKILRATPSLHTTRQGSGPTIVFLHGIASSSATWYSIIPKLTNRYECITLDLLGFGDSPKPDWLDYSTEDHVRSISRTIRKLKLSEPFIMVGHSLGSLLACRYASENPNRISKLIMISPPIYIAAEHHKDAASRAATDVYFRLYRFLREHKDFTIKNAARVDKLLPGAGLLDITENNWLPFIRSLENAIEHQTTITDISSVRAPIDVIYGKLDEFIIPNNLKLISSMKNIVTTSVNASTHVIRKPLAEAVINAVNTK